MTSCNQFASWGANEKNIDGLRNHFIRSSFGPWTVHAVRGKLEQVNEYACNLDRRRSLLYGRRDDAILRRQVHPLASAHGAKFTERRSGQRGSWGQSRLTRAGEGR